MPAFRAIIALPVRADSQSPISAQLGKPANDGYPQIPGVAHVALQRVRRLLSTEIPYPLRSALERGVVTPLQPVGVGGNWLLVSAEAWAHPLPWASSVVIVHLVAKADADGNADVLDRMLRPSTAEGQELRATVLATPGTAAEDRGLALALTDDVGTTSGGDGIIWLAADRSPACLLQFHSRHALSLLVASVQHLAIRQIISCWPKSPSDRKGFDRVRSMLFELRHNCDWPVLHFDDGVDAIYHQLRSRLGIGTTLGALLAEQSDHLQLRQARATHLLSVLGLVLTVLVAVVPILAAIL